MVLGRKPGFWFASVWLRQGAWWFTVSVLNVEAEQTVCLMVPVQSIIMAPTAQGAVPACSIALTVA